jgi:hypothetical protein
VLSIKGYPRGTPPVDPIAERLKRSGFKGATDRLDALIAPLARRCRIVERDGELLLEDPEGHHEFSELEDIGLPEWAEAARSTKRVLVVYGSGFGFDRPSLERIDRVLQAGDALCGLVSYEKAA